jgi:D-serine deaminase-like pyridoxal phosphate-dependent protein
MPYQRSAPPRRSRIMIEPGTPIEDLDTPCLVIDLDRMDQNIRNWQEAVNHTTAKLRPHVKTHKVPAIAQMQLAAGAHGITVAKVSEAEVFAANGCTDIFIAYPVIGLQKWQRAASLARDVTLTVGVESAYGAQGLSAAAAAAGTTIRVRVEIDTGLHRSGVQPGDAAALCQLIQSLPGLDLDGIFSVRRTSFAGAAGRDVAEVGRAEGEEMVALADGLRRAGIPIREVSVGSTPTARYAAQVPGVTEVRPGTYIFGDYMLSARGVIDEDDVALSILCTVVSRPGADTATVDGGSKTFSGDIFPGRLNLPGYARAVGMDAVVESLSEEHGVVRLSAGADPQVGDRIAFQPIHVCPTVNLSDELIGMRDDRVEQVWPILARGKRT